jgi:predicted amidohydrolase YtcJ
MSGKWNNGRAKFGDSFLAHTGRERSQLTYPLRSLLAAGIPAAGSSDSPVSSYQPLLGIQVAVTEKTMSGADFAAITVTATIQGASLPMKPHRLTARGRT